LIAKSYFYTYVGSTRTGYIARHGMLMESPARYVKHVVKQTGGNPQATVDMMDASATEKRVAKRTIREMRHAAGVRSMDFIPVMLIGVAAVVGTRYLAIGIGDTALYIMAGMAATLWIALRVVIFRGAGRATG